MEQNQHIDAKALAIECGITQKQVWERARILKIQGTPIKETGKRERTMYSPAEAEAIKGYGRKAEKSTNDTQAEEINALDSGSLAIQQTVLSPAVQQFQAIQQTLEAFEDMASDAITDRLEQVNSRILLKTAKKLEARQTLDISTVFGVLSAPALPATPIPMFNADDRRRFLECL